MARTNPAKRLHKSKPVQGTKVRFGMPTLRGEEQLDEFHRRRKELAPSPKRKRKPRSK